MSVQVQASGFRVQGLAFRVWVPKPVNFDSKLENLLKLEQRVALRERLQMAWSAQSFVRREQV